MATFRKRGKSWEVQVRRQGHPSITRSFKSKPDADVWARQMESRIDRSELPHGYRDAQRVTVGDLLRRYRRDITPAKRSARQETYRIDRLLAHPMAGVPIGKLTPSLFAKLRDERLASVKTQAVRHDLNLLSHLFNTAIREWDTPLAANPVDKITKPAPSRNRERRIANADLDRLADQATGSYSPLLPLIRFGVETGMRKAEILSLRWEHVDLGNRLLHIPVTKNGHPRTIPLTSTAIGILQSAKEAALGRPFPLTVPWLRYAWDRVTAKAGLTDVHFHDLRHEAISRFFERGLSVPEVALISGHRDVRQLFRYTHLRAEDLAKKLT